MMGRDKIKELEEKIECLTNYIQYVEEENKRNTELIMSLTDCLETLVRKLSGR